MRTALVWIACIAAFVATCAVVALIDDPERRYLAGGVVGCAWALIALEVSER